MVADCSHGAASTPVPPAEDQMAPLAAVDDDAAKLVVAWRPESSLSGRGFASSDGGRCCSSGAFLQWRLRRRQRQRHGDISLGHGVTSSLLHSGIDGSAERVVQGLLGLPQKCSPTAMDADQAEYIDRIQIDAPTFRLPSVVRQSCSGFVSGAGKRCEQIAAAQTSEVWARSSRARVTAMCSVGEQPSSTSNLLATIVAGQVGRSANCSSFRARTTIETADVCKSGVVAVLC